MSRTNSPLRYPGGKSCLVDLAVNVLRLNGLEHGHYAEPYAGGCGLALSLLYAGHVSDIHINDIDDGVWAFWNCVLNGTDEFVELVDSTPVTIAEWMRQREIYRAGMRNNITEFAFATFFLNRTNRSGIIDGAGVIGGLAQSGVYKIDCRFNKDDLKRRILRVKKYSSRIHLTKLDASEFLRSADASLPSRAMFFIDPPYFGKGADLYTSFYGPSDHISIAKEIARLKHPWVVTYDDVPEIRSIYRSRRKFGFDISYSVREKRLGAELLIPSSRLRISPEIAERRVY